MKQRTTVLLAACLWSAGCSYMTDFSQKELDFSVLHEVEEETSFACNNDCDCTLLGPCFSCLGGFCGLAEDADHDGDRYLNVACSVSDSGCESLPDKYKPKKGNDCNDNDPLINPGMTDTCNGIDDNCNGRKDEDAATFGPSPAGPKKLLEGGFHFSFCPFGDNSFIAWDNAPLGSQVRSGFFDASGTLLNNELLSEEGFGPDIACVPDGGSLAAYSDRSQGKAVIALQKLDTFGGPRDGEDPVRIDDGTGTGGDMTDAAVAYLATTAPPLIAVAWLIHDISDIASAQVNVTVLDSITGDPVSLSVGGLPSSPFTIPGNYPNFSFERLDLETFLTRDEVTGNIISQGFALLWNTADGIYFAALPCTRNAETSEMSCTGNVSAAFSFPSKMARLPDLVWAGDRFFVVAAVTASEATPTDLGFAQILEQGGSWAISEIFLQDQARTDVIEGRAQAYPSLVWVDDMNEVILSWANEDNESIDNRVVKFARLMLNADTELELPVPMVYTVSDDPVFAGAPQVVYRRAALIEGFTVGWTERDSSADGGVEMNFRLVSCVGSGR